MKKPLIFFICVFQFGCNYSLSKTPLNFTQGNTGLNQTPAGTVVSYKVIETSIIQPKCLDCHSSAVGNIGGVNLETYENVTANLGLIRSDVESNRMPFNRPSLTAKEKEILFTWIDAGAPQNGGTTTSPTPIDTNPPNPEPPPEVEFFTYQMVRTEVLQPRCIGCHSKAGGNRGRVNLETYENVSALSNIIEKEIEKGSMPKPTNKPLTAIQKNMILKWIASGAPQN